MITQNGKFHPLNSSLFSAQLKLEGKVRESSRPLEKAATQLLLMRSAPVNGPAPKSRFTVNKPPLTAIGATAIGPDTTLPMLAAS